MAVYNMTGGPANPHLLDSFEHLLLCKSLCNDYTGYSFKYFLMYHISYMLFYFPSNYICSDME